MNTYGEKYELMINIKKENGKHTICYRYYKTLTGALRAYEMWKKKAFWVFLHQRNDDTYKYDYIM